MVSLERRATPAQRKILNIIEGAVLNAYDAHNQPRDTWFARSIAKRATGLLSAQWSEVMSANSRLTTRGAGTANVCRACERREHTARLWARREYAILVSGKKTTKVDQSRETRRESSQYSRRFPLLELWNRLKREMYQVTRSGNQEKSDAYVFLLREIDKLHRQYIMAEFG